MTIHRAAAPFSLALRERIASGPLFDRQYATWPGAAFGNDDNGTCLWIALAEAEPENCHRTSDAEVDDLIRRNDDGHYKVRANLIRDLLGADAAIGAGDGAGATP